jgi:predicted Zn-dependent protease with MMP-like domain
MTRRFPRRSTRWRLRLTEEEIERVVEEALDSLPADFAARMDNVFVTVEDAPSDDDLRGVGIDPGDDEARHSLFGLYQGVPLTQRDIFYDALPDRVVIYAETIRRQCNDRREAVEEVRKTLLHELGHHFGMEEEDMPY